MTSNPSRHVGTRTREEREQRGWSQTNLGNRLADHGFPMSANSVGRLEAGTRPTLIDEVWALAAVFDVDPAALLPLQADQAGLAVVNALEAELVRQRDRFFPAARLARLGELSDEARERIAEDGGHP